MSASVSLGATIKRANSGFVAMLRCYCASPTLSSQAHPRDPAEVILKVPRRDRSVRAGWAFSLGMTKLALHPSHFQLPPYNPVQQPEQRKARSDQDDGVEDEHIHLHPEILFVLAEKHIRFSPTAIIALFHLRVRNQIGHFLVQIERLRGYRTIGVLELAAIKRLLAI